MDEIALLGVELERVELVVQGLDPPVQRAVELDRVAVRGHERRQHLFDALDLAGRIGGGHGIERARHTAQYFTGRLQRNHRVLEGRHRAHPGDRGDLPPVLGERDVESRQVVLGADVGVRGQLVGERARCEKRVGRGIRHVLSLSRTLARPCLQRNACKQLLVALPL